MTRRVALITEHASPLAVLGGVDAGGQNVYVDHLARSLAALGDEVDVFTRRDAPNLPDVVDLAPGVRVIHIGAGPAPMWMTRTPGARSTTSGRFGASRRVKTSTSSPRAASERAR